MRIKISFRLFFCLLLPFMMWSVLCDAEHIVGGEIRMKSLGSNQYEITLIQFWDGNHLRPSTDTTAGNLDLEAYLFIYRKGTNTLMDSVLVRFQYTEDIIYQNKSCASARSLRTVLGLYTGEITLPPDVYNDPGGYFIVWERCCRNGDIDNIKAPGDAGMVFYLEFPPTTMTNSSPEIHFPNGQYICANQKFSMNMSATDSDQDQLKYSLVVPMMGNTNPTMVFGVSTPKGSYPIVEWQDHININNVIPGPAPLSIHPTTGILSVVANQTGLYVFAIQCEEFRNGRRIGLVRRDFQLLVIDCNLDKPEPPIITINDLPVENEVLICSGNSILLETESAADSYFQWQKDGLNLKDASGNELMVNEGGTYTVSKSFIRKCSMDALSKPLKVSVVGPPETVIVVEKDVLCPGETMEISSILEFDELKKQTYLWSLNGNEIDRNVSSVVVSAPGTYILQIADMVLECENSDTITISRDSLNVYLPDTLKAKRGVPLTIEPDVVPLNSNNTYHWLPEDSGLKSSPSARRATVSPYYSSLYAVEVTSPGGCRGVDSVWIQLIEPLLIPGAFSPDGNDLNDSFEIIDSGKQVMEVTIFNRWGMVIFNSKRYLTPWDGKYKNEFVPPGSYPYIVKTIDGELRGQVMVLR